MGHSEGDSTLGHLVPYVDPNRDFYDGGGRDRSFSVASIASTSFQSQVNFGPSYNDHGHTALPSVAENGLSSNIQYGGLHKIPSHYRSTANVYQSMHRSNIPGLGHPGFSNDTRFGTTKDFIPRPLAAARQSAAYRQNKDRTQTYHSIKAPHSRSRGKNVKRDFTQRPKSGHLRYSQMMGGPMEISMHMPTSMPMMQLIPAPEFDYQVPVMPAASYQPQLFQVTEQQTKPLRSLPPLPLVGGQPPTGYGSRPDRKVHKRPSKLPPTWLGNPPQMGSLVIERSDMDPEVQNEDGNRTLQCWAQAFFTDVSLGQVISPRMPITPKKKNSAIPQQHMDKDEWWMYYTCLDREEQYEIVATLWNLEASIIVVEVYDNRGELIGYKGYRVDPVRPTMMPGITDLVGPLSQYTSLLTRNINPVFNATDDELNGHEEYSRSIEEEHSDREFIRQVAFLGPQDFEEEMLPRYRRVRNQRPRTGHARQVSEDTAIFFNEFNFGLPEKSAEIQYVGYSILGEAAKVPSCPSTPVPLRSRTGLIGNLADAQSRISSPGNMDLLDSRVTPPVRSSSTGLLGRRN